MGTSPETLRTWEHEGLIYPERSEKGTRYFTEKDLVRLRQIKQLRTAQKLNFAAIRRELGTAEAKPAGDGAGEMRLPEEVGKRLRQLRLRHQMTLKEVAEISGLSVSFISALERGRIGASIASLRTIGNVFDISWRDIFETEPMERSRLVRFENRPSAQLPNGIRFEDLATTGSLMDPGVMYFPPHTGSGDQFTHEGEEFVYVTSGTLFVRLNENPPKTYQLRSKDCLYFPSSVPHLWWTEEAEAEVIYVNSPPSF